MRSDRNGYTLVEVLVVIVILGVVSTGIMVVFLTSQEEYRVRDATIRMQQQARLAMYDMEREMKLTGYGFMDLGNLKIKAYLKNDEMVWAVFKTDDGGVGKAEKTDSVTLRYLDSETDTTTDVTLTEASNGSSSNFRVSSAAGFQDSDLFLVYDPSDLGKPASMYQVTGTAGGDTLQHNPGSQGPYNRPGGLGVSYPAGSKIINLRGMKAREVKYSVDASHNLVKEVTQDGAGASTRRIIALGIEDLQVRYRFRNGEWRDAPVENDPNLDVNNLRSVRLSLIARTAKPDPRYADSQPHQLSGIHGNGEAYAGQGYRRMEMSTIINLRNLAMRDQL